MRRVVRFVERTIRAVRLRGRATRGSRKPLRVLAGFGLLPIPGPVDEAVLLLVAVPLALLYREPLAEAWRAQPRPDCARRPFVESCTLLSQSRHRLVTSSGIVGM